MMIVLLGLLVLDFVNYPFLLKIKNLCILERMENTSNIIREIVMTQEMSYMMSYTREKNELKSTIQLQSAEIGRLLSKVQLWKAKYEEVFLQIV